MLRIETRLVDSKRYKWRQGILVLGFVVLFCSQLLIGGRGSSGLIERNNWVFPFDDPDTLTTLIVIVYFSSLTVVIYLGYSTHSVGELRVREESLKVGDSVFRFEDMKYLKIDINSPKVYGKRNAKQGFNNWLEFATNEHQVKHEFYIEDYAMEDSLVYFLEEVKSNYDMPVTVDVKSGEPIESWFGSMFGNG